jgi:hypothetical protein
MIDNILVLLPNNGYEVLFSEDWETGTISPTKWTTVNNNDDGILELVDLNAVPETPTPGSGMSNWEIYR